MPKSGTIALAIALSVSAACGGSSDQPGALPQPASGSSASGPRLYVSDETGGNVVVIDASTGEIRSRISVGKRPRGLRLSHDGRQLYVALSGSPIAGPGVDESKLPPADRSADGIGVIDLAAGRLVRTLKSGQDPEAFDLSPDGATLYVSNEETAEMSTVDVASGDIRSRVTVGEEPEGVTVRPGGREVYVTCENDNEVVAVDTGSGKVVARYKVGPRPRAVAFTTDGASGFVTNENDGSVSIIEPATQRVAARIQIPKAEGAAFAARPMGAVLSPDGTQVFVSLGRARSIAVIDVAGQKLLRTIPDVGERPWGIAVSRDGRTVFTANGPSADVSFVDLSSGTIRRVATGGSPWGVVVSEGR